MALVVDADLLVALATDGTRGETIADRFGDWADMGEELVEKSHLNPRASSSEVDLERPDASAADRRPATL